MTTPIDFLNILVERMDAAGIRFAVTSGMACVWYGLQQTTKDIDIVISADHLARLLDLLESQEREFPPWRVSYRTIFGAPLDPAYMRHGWTSHLSIHDRADSPEQRLDVFCRPPRVDVVESDPVKKEFASRDTVARMKRTDRDRDWPIVDGLGLQLRRRDPERALLHIQDAVLLRETWTTATSDARARAEARRPLLGLIDLVRDDDSLDAWIRRERIVWETANQERYGLYRTSWKDFHRRWRADDAFDWPTSDRCRTQHERLLEATSRFGLARDPLGTAGREAIYERATRRAAVRAGASPAEIARVAPPLREVLP